MTDSAIRTLITACKTAIKRGDFAEADRIVARLKERAPTHVDTRGLELELLISQKQYDEAQRLSDHLTKLFPGSGRVWFLAGQVAFFQRNYRRAQTCFEESHNAYPHWRSKQWLAKSLTNLGQFEQAEAILRSLVQTKAVCHWDLAWLHERMGYYDKAIAAVETYLEIFPQNEQAIAKCTALRAKLTESEDVIEQVQLMEDLGEEIPEHLVARYLESLIENGQSTPLRELVRRSQQLYSTRTRLQLGWICYHNQIHDMAFELFLPSVASQLNNYKFLSTIEKTARFSGRQTELAEVYQALAPKAPALYNRSKKLTNDS